MSSNVANPSPPRIIAVSMVKNEQDIIEPFLRHTSRLVDALIILDNASLDRTREIIVACARDLDNIVFADNMEFGYAQEWKMTQLLNYCQTAFFADFVFFLDADEFIECPDRQTLLRSLCEIPSPGVGLMPWKTFVLDEQPPQAEMHPPASFVRRRLEERPQHYKSVLRLDGEYICGLIVTQGNHMVKRFNFEALPSVILSDIALMHFPVRSIEQIVCKGVVGWMANITKNKGRDLAAQWRNVFDQVKLGAPGIQHSDLLRMSLEYASEGEGDVATVQERPNVHTERIHSSGRPEDAIALIAKSWEMSILGAPLPTIKARDGEFIDLAPFRFAAEKYQPLSVLDVGCETTAYIQLSLELGARNALGVGAMPYSDSLPPEQYMCIDRSGNINIVRTFDMIICLEFIQKLDDGMAEKLLDSISANAGKVIIFSAATPDQPGAGSNHQRSFAFWLDHWAQRGWHPHEVDTLGMRALATLSWFRRNLVVLLKREPIRQQANLKNIAERPYIWWDQRPGIRSYTQSEPMPMPPAGYVKVAPWDE